MRFSHKSLSIDAPPFGLSVCKIEDLLYSWRALGCMFFELSARIHGVFFFLYCLVIGNIPLDF